MSTPSASSPPPALGIDRATLVAIAVVAYALANVVHEGLGHGGACALGGGELKTWNAVYFECGDAAMSPGGVRWLAAGGTLANLAVAALAFLALAATRRRGATTGRYSLWLVGTLDLLQATGYWLFSGIAGIGDWVVVVRGWEPVWAWRVLLAVAGAAGYAASVAIGLRTLVPFLGAGADRLRRARALTLLPYLAGGVLYVAAGVLNPESFLLVLISAAAASFGGASALAWMTDRLRNESRFPPSAAAPLRLRRSAAWIAVGAVVTLLFVVVLGRGVALSVAVATLR